MTGTGSTVAPKGSERAVSAGNREECWRQGHIMNIRVMYFLDSLSGIGGGDFIMVN